MWYQSRRSSDCGGGVAESDWERFRQECLQSIQVLVQALRTEIKDWRLKNETTHQSLLSDLRRIKKAESVVREFTESRSEVAPPIINNGERAGLDKSTDLSVGELRSDVVTNGQLRELPSEDVKPTIIKKGARRWRRHSRQKWRRWKQLRPVMASMKARFIGGRRSPIPCCRSGKIRSTISNCPSNHSGNLLFHPSTIARSNYGCHTNCDWTVYHVVSDDNLLGNDVIIYGMLVYFNWDPGGVKILVWSLMFVMLVCCSLFPFLSLIVLLMISALQHPNLVQLCGCCVEGNKLSVEWFLVTDGSLWQSCGMKGGCWNLVKLCDMSFNGFSAYSIWDLGGVCLLSGSKRICVGTWNVGVKKPPDDLDIDDWLDMLEPANVYVLGFEEFVPLNNSLRDEENLILINSLVCDRDEMWKMTIIIFFLLICALIFVSVGTQVTGFASIDCGGAEPYTNEMRLGMVPNNDIVCSQTYLIRASFLYGNFDKSNMYPRLVFKLNDFGREIGEITISLALAADLVAFLVDTTFIGRLGPVELAAVGFSIGVSKHTSKIVIYPLVCVTTSFFVEENAHAIAVESEEDFLLLNTKMKELWLSVDYEERMTGSLLSFGHNESDIFKSDIRYMSSVSLALEAGGVLGILQAIFLILATKIILSMMGIAYELPMLDPALRYFTLRSLGAPAVLLFLFMQGMFQGLKDTTMPLYATMAGDFANIFLDWLFIFVFCLVVSGVVLAHILSHYLISLILLLKLVKQVKFISSMKDLQFHRFFKNGFLLLQRVLAITFCVTLRASLASCMDATIMSAFQLSLQVWLAKSLLAQGLAVAGQIIFASAFSEEDYVKVTQWDSILCPTQSVNCLALVFVGFLMIETVSGPWKKSEKFKIGVKNIQSPPSMIRITATRSETFVVKDYHQEAYKKPSMNNEVWRWEKVGLGNLIGIPAVISGGLKNATSTFNGLHCLVCVKSGNQVDLIFVIGNPVPGDWTEIWPTNLLGVKAYDIYNSDNLYNGQALNNLGSVYVDCGQLHLATDCYTNALKLPHTRAHQGFVRVPCIQNDRTSAYDEMTINYMHDKSETLRKRYLTHPWDVI